MKSPTETALRAVIAFALVAASAHLIGFGWAAGTSFHDADARFAIAP